MVRQIQKTQEQELEIPQELVTKFDDDRELVTQFIKEGYSISELQNSQILHPTKFDPICILEDGRTIGMWLDGGKKYQEDSRTYQDRRNRFF